MNFWRTRLKTRGAFNTPRKLRFAKSRAKKNAIIAKYPLLSKIFGTKRDLSLANPDIATWSSGMLSEIVQLHTESKTEMSFKCGDHRQASLLPISSSCGKQQFIDKDTRNNWVLDVINISKGDMSLLDAIDCIRTRLDAYEREAVSRDGIMDTVDDDEHGEGIAVAKAGTDVGVDGVVAIVLVSVFVWTNSII